MSSRYDKLNHLLAFQQKSHYQHIENPRATIRIDPPQRKAYSLHYKTKTTNEKDRQRKLQNKKMLFNLLEIYNGQGLLTKMEESSKQAEERRNKSLLKSFKKLQEEKEIRKENKDLLQHIQNVEPIIGNKRDWNRHFEQHQEIQKKLCNYTVRNAMNMTAFKTFYQQKKRKLLSEEKGLSERQSEEKERQKERVSQGLEKEKEEVSTKKKNRRKRRAKKAENKSISEDNHQQP